MKILQIDYDFYYYPKDYPCMEKFIAYANENYNTFIELTRFETDNCTFPYFINEETKQVYLNIGKIEKINEEEVTVLSRNEYDNRLEKIVSEKCINCENYEEDAEDVGLKGYRDKISLDGECWGYKQKK